MEDFYLISQQYKIYLKSRINKLEIGFMSRSFGTVTFWDSCLTIKLKKARFTRLRLSAMCVIQKMGSQIYPDRLPLLRKKMVRHEVNTHV